jgi:ribulose-5-phosphate 4-epimerase/fuculose-1-phosphate aldolase
MKAVQHSRSLAAMGVSMHEQAIRPRSTEELLKRGTEVRR